jgi:hypothetical protein
VWLRSTLWSLEVAPQGPHNPQSAPQVQKAWAGYIALLGFVLLRDVLDLPALAAQVPLGQQVASQAVQQALGAPALEGWFLLCLALLIGHRLADLKDRLAQTQAIGVQVRLQSGAIHQSADRVMHHKQRVEAPFVPLLACGNVTPSAARAGAF